MLHSQLTQSQSTPEPPTTRESAIKQATDNLRNAIGKSSRGKGFVGKTGKRVQVDIPLLDETSKAVVELCRDLLKSMPRDIAKQVLPILLLAAPKLDQIEEVQDLLQRCRGPAVIILNAGWTPDQLSPPQRNALQAFQQIYAFVPLGFKV
ncbi:hypothetical protein WJX84_005485 [Apatococcus fuscideae]|uniref:DUF1995 domain-containing protein n=1 Tax=Apatococcus fuscideae TaxID=2026836 RepID=A0AAW1SQQ9_9CHLO